MGCTVGCNDGWKDGNREGTKLGHSNGCFVGKPEGGNVNCEEGEEVGALRG